MVMLKEARNRVDLIGKLQALGRVPPAEASIEELEKILAEAERK